MILRSVLLAVAATALLAAADPRLLDIRYVYVLPMAGGLDQYLANRLTQHGRYQVVTDPAKADAILTDQVGTVFEERFASLYPPPTPVKPEEKEEEIVAPAKEGTDTDTAKRKPKPQPQEERSMVSMMTSGPSSPRVSSFTRGKGNVYLVERSSRAVIWSVYMRPRNTGPDEMDRTADRIVNNMDNALEKSQKDLDKAAKRSAATMPLPVPPPQAAPAAAPAPASAPPPPSKPAPAVK